jgi:hypothetical protein
MIGACLIVVNHRTGRPRGDGRAGVLQDKIHSYKYEGRTGCSLIFGRLLASGVGCQ